MASGAGSASVQRSVVVVLVVMVRTWPRLFPEVMVITPPVHVPVVQVLPESTNEAALDPALAAPIAWAESFTLP